MSKCKCGKKISFYAKQCQKCYIKIMIHPKGKEHPSFIKGKPKCIYCKKEIDYRAKMCGDCHHRLQRGKNHPSTGIKRPDLSLRNKLNPQKGRDNPRFGKLALHGKKIKYRGIWMRSTWEVAYAKYLDKQGTKWQYESKTFDLGNYTYTPDFYLPKTNTYIEIKGWWRDNAKRKFELFKEKYKNVKIQVIKENKLKELEII